MTKPIEFKLSSGQYLLLKPLGNRAISKVAGVARQDAVILILDPRGNLFTSLPGRRHIRQAMNQNCALRRSTIECLHKLKSLTAEEYAAEIAFLERDEKLQDFRFHSQELSTAEKFFGFELTKAQRRKVDAKDPRSGKGR